MYMYEQYEYQINVFGEDCLGSNNGATRPVAVQDVIVFSAFHDSDAISREEFEMAEKHQKPVISAK